MNEERLAISNCWSVKNDQSSVTSSSSATSSSSVIISCNSPSQIVKRRTSISMDSPSTRVAKRRCELTDNVA